MFNPHVQPILTFKTLELPIPNVLLQRTPRAQVVPRGATVTVPVGSGRSQARAGPGFVVPPPVMFGGLYNYTGLSENRVYSQL